MKRILFFFAAAVFNIAFSGWSQIIVDDTFADGTRTNENLPVQSAWFVNTSTAPGNIANVATNALTFTNSTSSSRIYWTYFTSNSPALGLDINGNATNGYPVTITNGQMIRATMVMTPVNVYSNSASSLRIGFLDYETNAAGRVFRDTSSISSSGIGVTGYRMDLNYSSVFQLNSPVGLNVRSNVTDSVNGGDPLGKAAVWFSLGSAPAGQSNAPGFISGTSYIIDFSVARYPDAGGVNFGSNVITAVIKGGTLNLTNRQTDISGYNYNRFDTYMLRDNRSTETADAFIISEFKVQLLPISSVSTGPVLLSPSVSGGNLVLSWPADHIGWALQSQTNTLALGLRSNWAAVSGSTTTNKIIVPLDAGNGAVFFRLISP